MKNVKPIFARAIILIAIATVSLSISCDSVDLSPVDCDECYTLEPEFGQIELRLTINDENPEVTIKLYEDVFYEANLIYTKIVKRSSTLLEIDTNREYVVKAEYVKNGRSYQVVNRARLKTKLNRESCSEPCYYIVKRSVDLRIKD
ncbi:MAG: hypothetical protein PHE03_07990 [Bacteroidales bacterium]|nr:hypothetical protein [Bacteroidales bacterium]MDD3892226.1 hypothetical protein [Bacteroidales bacterium]